MLGKNLFFRKKYPQPLHGVDFYLLFSVVTILAFGLIMVLSAGSVRGMNANQNSYFFVFQQMKWALLGGACACFICLFPYQFFRKFARLGIFLSALLLFLVMFSDAAKAVNGSARWIKLGPVNVQPSEVAKLALILYLAHIFDRYPIKKIPDIGRSVAVMLPIFLMVYKQPDLGTTLVLIGTCGSMLWTTGLPLRFFGIVVPLFAAAGLYLVKRTEYQWNRILVWMDPWKYSDGLGYQITNAEIAIGSGGLFGIGLGHSMQKFGYLPETYTDMIFAIIGEELGLMGCLMLIGLYILFFSRSFYLSANYTDRFARFLSFGLTVSLAIQTVMNLAVVTGVMPVTGVTLPMVSYGGSSLVITLVEVGLLLNISRYSRVSEAQHYHYRTADTVNR